MGVSRFIGCKTCRAGRPVVCLLGDGVFMMTMQELSTMAQYDIPVVVVLANNRCWMAIEDLQQGNAWRGVRSAIVFLHGTRPLAGFWPRLPEALVLRRRRSPRGSVRAAVGAALASGKPALIEVDVTNRYPSRRRA
jgi:acetolactate synthase-1/2/3 large subunit